MSATLPRELQDRLEIRDLIDNWVLWRDSGDWRRLSTLWHHRGRMVTTWCDVSATDFVAMCERAWTSGSINASHFLGGTSIDVQGERAVAQTKMSITQRAQLHGVAVDIICTGRFYDLLERGSGGWMLLLRHPIYEMDRVQTIEPAARLEVDRELLGKWPSGYAHLAYLQTTLGFRVNPNLPGKTGPELERLMQRGRAWLAGSSIDQGLAGLGS